MRKVRSCARWPVSVGELKSPGKKETGEARASRSRKAKKSSRKKIDGGSKGNPDCQRSAETGKVVVPGGRSRHIVRGRGSKSRGDGFHCWRACPPRVKKGKTGLLGQGCSEASMAEQGNGEAPQRESRFGFRLVRRAGAKK